MMKLGKHTGSVMNHVYSRMTKDAPEPADGMAATILCWTDRRAATIVEVCRTGQYPVVWVREDIATRTDKNGFSEDQEYTFTPNPQGNLYRFRFKNGSWEEIVMNEKTGRWNKAESSHGLLVGMRNHYWDPCF